MDIYLKEYFGAFYKMNDVSSSSTVASEIGSKSSISRSVMISTSFGLSFIVEEECNSLAVKGISVVFFSSIF